MAKLKGSQIYPSTSGIEDQKTQKFARQLVQIQDEINRKIARISFNQSESLSVGDTGSADTEFSVTTHSGKVPVGFILTKSDKACAIYDSGTAWTTNAIYLKCNVANVAIAITVF